MAQRRSTSTCIASQLTVVYIIIQAQPTHTNIALHRAVSRQLTTNVRTRRYLDI